MGGCVSVPAHPLKHILISNCPDLCAVWTPAGAQTMARLMVKPAAQTSNLHICFICL